MESTYHKGAAAGPRGRFLIAMRPEPATAENAAEMARMLGMKPELMKDVLGGALPRVIASRSTREEADALARILSARGRESVAWDRESPQSPLFQAERLTLEAGQFVFEHKTLGRRFIAARDVQSIVGVRLWTDEATEKVLFGKARPTGSGQQLPERALLIVPDPTRAEPGVLSTRTVDTGRVPFPEAAASKLLQEAVTRARALLPQRVIEVRTSASSLGFQKGDGDPLEWVLQLFARLPPLPVGARPAG
jgi:hypothetical protein